MSVLDWPVSRTCDWLAALAIVASLGLSPSTANAADWQPAEGPLMTRWAKEISPDNVHPEYPRPQMVRDTWANLNGLWDYAIRPKAETEPPAEWDGKILVPFPIESALSGVMKPVGPDQRLWYRRTFQLPEEFEHPNVLLHFGAVDWHTVVWVDGKKIGEHKGGYDPFSFDITKAAEYNPISLPGQKRPEHEFVVSVWDPTDAEAQPRGKQVRDPKGIWYTAVTGIWQTVWLEAVNPSRITDLKMVPDIDNGTLKVIARVTGMSEGDQPELRFVANDEGRVVADVKTSFDPPEPGQTVDVTVELEIAEPRLWSPANPFLYDLKAGLFVGPSMQVDEIASYFGMRKIEFKKDVDGYNRMFLNGEPLFQYGPLDQGWWPDGLYTAPTDEALKYDIEVTKQLGFNMARKHVKVEPARWYYWCDKLGLLVWQDMPSAFSTEHPEQKLPRGAEHDAPFPKEAKEIFRRELKALIDTHKNHPCIIAWVPFNEGWGQHDTNEILKWTAEYDPTRLVDGPSGWEDRGWGHLKDMHVYPGPGMFPPMEDRVSALGEFGGLGWPVAEHLWWDKRNWGYRTYHSQEELEQNYMQLMRQLRPLIGRGLAAAIYTQTTDVEGEVNGLMTYDREIIKLDPEKIAAVHKTFYEPPPQVSIQPIVPTSEKEPQTWHFTTTKPADDWMQASSDNSGWQSAPGGFGQKETPGSFVRTDWTTPDVWLRRTFELNDAKVSKPHLRIHHDEDATVYINGVLAAKVTGYTTDYIEIELSDEARQALREGTNTLAVHCHQTGGGQYIDVGLVDVIETPREKKR